MATIKPFEITTETGYAKVNSVVEVSSWFYRVFISVPDKYANVVLGGGAEEGISFEMIEFNELNDNGDDLRINGWTDRVYFTPCGDEYFGSDNYFEIANIIPQKGEYELWLIDMNFIHEQSKIIQ